MKHYFMWLFALLIITVIGGATDGTDGMIMMCVFYIAIASGVTAVTVLHIMTWCIFHKEVEKMEEAKEDGVE